MDHSACREELEAYALGALEPDEVELVREHVARCSECQAELASLERTANALPAALAVASPLRTHPSLKRRMVAGLQARRAPRLWPRPWLWPVVAIVALVLFVAPSLYALSLRQQLAEGQVLRQQSLEKVQTQLSQQDQFRVFEVLDASTTDKRLLRSVDPDHPDAYGKLWTRSDDADVVIMVNQLPQPGPRQHYSLILTTADGRTVDAGRLLVDRDGFAMLLFTADRKSPAYRAAIVSLDETPMVAWRGSR